MSSCVHDGVAAVHAVGDGGVVAQVGDRDVDRVRIDAMQTHRCVDLRG